MLRTKEEIKERIRMEISEEINSASFMEVTTFIENLTNKIYEICIEEIENRRRF